MRNWILFVIRRRRAVLTAISILTLGLISQLKYVDLIIDPDNILPQEHRFVKANDIIEKTFGNKFTVVVTLSPKEGLIYQTDFLQTVQQFTDEIRLAPGIIDSHLNGIATDHAKVLKLTSFGPVPVPLMAEIPQTQEDMDLLRANLHSDPVFEGLLYSSDEKTTQIVAEFSKIEGGFGAIRNNVNHIAEKFSDRIDVNVSGLPIFLAELESLSKRMAFLFPLAVLIIGLIHFEAFRTLQAMFLPLVTALLAVIWSVGIIGLLRQSFDVFNASTPILILAIAAGHAVQILKRYYEEFAKLEARQDLPLVQKNWMAIEEAMVAIGPVMIVACVVAALGFFSLIIFEIKTVRTFGLFTGFGVLSALAIELTFIPALRAILRPPEAVEKVKEASHSIWDRIIQRLYLLSTASPVFVFKVFAVGILILGFGGRMLIVDNSQKGYFFDSLDVKRADSKINTQMAGTNLIYVMISSPEVSVLSSEILTNVDELQLFLERQPNVGKTISVNNFVKSVNKSLNGETLQSYSLPSGSAELELIAQGLNANSRSSISSFVSEDLSKTVIAVFIKTDSSAYIEELAGNIQGFVNGRFKPGVAVEVGGGAVNGVALNEVLIQEKIMNIAQILLAVILVTSIVFRSVLAGLLISVPLIVAVIANFGIMGLLGIPLQIATALVSAMAVGIGADYGIYMSYRLREELRKSSDEDEAFKRAYLSAGKAVLFVSSAVAGGFGVLMLSWGFYIHIWMGFLIMTAMVTSSMAALTLFPALIKLLRPKFIFGGKQLVPDA